MNRVTRCIDANALGTSVLLLAFMLMSNTLLAVSPELKVSGNKIVTVVGNCPVFLKGVNLTSLEWKDVSDGPVLTSAQTVVGSWGANIVRMPVNQDRWLGTACGTVASSYQAQYDGVVNWCHNNNAYVMLDLHWSDTGVAGGGSVCTSGQHDMPDDNSTTFWTSVATRYANDPAVLFDLYNEPKGIASWTEWRNGGSAQTDGGYHSPGMQALLGTIRATGAKNIVVAGGLNWAFDLTQIPTYALNDATGNGVVYATHIYPWKASPCTQAGGCFDGAVPAATHNNYAVMVTEFGQDNWNENVPYNTWAQSVMDWAKTNANGYIAWCLHNSATPCLITDWAYTPSSWFGTTVKADMLATSAGGCVGTPTNTSTPSRTVTRTSTASASPTGTSTPSITPTRSATPTATGTRTVSPSSTSTSTVTANPSYTVTVTSSNTPAVPPTFTDTSTPTSTRSATPSASATATSSRTATPTVTPPNSFTTTSTATASPSRTASATATATPTASATRSATPSQTLGVPSLTDTPSLSPTSSASPTASATPTASRTVTGSPSASATPTATSSQTPGVPSLTDTPSISATFSHSATTTPSSSATGTSTAGIPSVTNTPSLSPTPSASSTPSGSSTTTPTSSSTSTVLAGSATDTSTSTATPTFTATSTTGAAAATPPPGLATADPNGPLEILQVVAVPNPGPSSITVELGGPADRVAVRLYSRSMVLISEVTAPGAGGRWLNVPLPPDWSQGLSLGTYFVTAQAHRGERHSTTKIGKFFLVR